MFRPIRTRTGSIDSCPYNTPLLFTNHTPYLPSLQWIAPPGPLVTGLIRIRITSGRPIGVESCNPAAGRFPVGHALQRDSEKKMPDYPEVRIVAARKSLSITDLPWFHTTIPAWR